MLGSNYWRMALKRHADQIEQLQESNEWTEKLGARIEMLVSVSCFFVRRLNDHDLIPEDIATRSVPLLEYDADSDEDPPEEGFYLTSDLGRGRPWNGTWFIKVVQQVIHNDYFVPIMTEHGGLDSILFCGPPRPPRNEYEEVDRMFDGDPPRYQKRLDIEDLVSLLREAAEAEEPE